MRLALVLFLSAFSLCTAASALADQQVGKTAAVNQSANGTPPHQKPRTVEIGDKIFHNESIKTNSSGLVQILLADGTTFTVGPNSKLRIDKFVYNPNKGTAKVAASLSKGVFRFVGGKTSKTPGGVKLHTPVGTVGIRGGIANIALNKRNGIPPHLDLLFGNTIVLTRNGKVVAVVRKAGNSIVVGKNKVHVVKTPAHWISALQKVVGGTPGRHGGAKKVPTDKTVADLLNQLLSAGGGGSGGGGGGSCQVTIGKGGARQLVDPAGLGSG